MIGDEERREVARKLRERTKKPMGKSMQRMFTDTLGVYAHRNSWMNPGKATNRWYVIVNCLADLIDRPTCRKLIPDEMEGLAFCSNCGAEIGEHSVPSYCPNCGRQVVK